MQRRATKQSRAANKDEKAFQAWLKNRPCCITEEYGVDVHHCKGSTFKHNKVLIGHWFCIPLSKEKHNEYHSGTKAFKEKYGLQRELWMSLCNEYYRETGAVIPVEVERAIFDCGY